MAAVRDRMRTQASARAADEAAAAPSPEPRPRATRAPLHDHELEQLEAEARYHHDRFHLYQARVISGSAAPTSATRLRELRRTAEAAAYRLKHARRKRGPDGQR